MVYDLLVHIYGPIVESNWRPRWPCRVEDLEGGDYGLGFRQIYDELTGYRGYNDFVRSDSLPGCDFFVGGKPGFIVEYDESQHFSQPRLLTLELIPKGLTVRFSVERWKHECSEVQARDNDPRYRDEQRAWYDVLRDILPAVHGQGGTARLMDATQPFCLIDKTNAKQVDEFEQLIAPRVVA
jgi:hypothetical protein